MALKSQSCLGYPWLLLYSDSHPLLVTTQLPPGWVGQPTLQEQLLGTPPGMRVQLAWTTPWADQAWAKLHGLHWGPAGWVPIAGSWLWQGLSQGWP